MKLESVMHSSISGKIPNPSRGSYAIQIPYLLVLIVGSGTLQAQGWGDHKMQILDPYDAFYI